MTIVNACDIPPDLRDCCIKPEALFLCPPYKQIEYCIENKSDGAYLPYAVSSRNAYEECKMIKESAAGGTNKMFSVSFSSSFK